MFYYLILFVFLYDAQIPNKCIPAKFYFCEHRLMEISAALFFFLRLDKIYLWTKVLLF